MVNIQSLDALLGALIPFVMAKISDQTFSRSAKLLICFAICLVVAGLRLLVGGEFNAEDIPTAIITVFVASQASYAVFKPVVVKLEGN